MKPQIVLKNVEIFTANKIVFKPLEATHRSELMVQKGLVVLYGMACSYDKGRDSYKKFFCLMKMNNRKKNTVGWRTF